MKIDEYQWQSDFAIKHRSEEGARMVMLVLQARKICVSEAAQARINGCTDLEQLERWVERAATIDKVDDLFN